MQKYGFFRQLFVLLENSLNEKTIFWPCSELNYCFSCLQLYHSRFGQPLKTIISLLFQPNYCISIFSKRHRVLIIPTKTPLPTKKALLLQKQKCRKFSSPNSSSLHKERTIPSKALHPTQNILLDLVTLNAKSYCELIIQQFLGILQKGFI